MSRIATKVLYGALLAGGISILGATAANAAETTGEDSVLGGSQVAPASSIPVSVQGIAVSLFGDSTTGAAQSDAQAATATPPGATTEGGDSTLGGTQVVPVVDVPIDASGIAVSVFGDSATGAAQTDSAEAPIDPAAAPAATTDGADSTLGGTQVVPIVGAPVQIGGIAVSLFGDSDATGPDGATLPASGAGAAPVTGGNDSVAGGSQIAGDIGLPISVGGIAIAPFGDATASTGSSAPAEGSGEGTASTSGESAIAGGTQVVPNVTAPIGIGGVAVSLTGDSSVGGGDEGSSATVPGSGGSATDGTDSVAGGTQIAPVIALPVQIGGIAISVTGDSSTGGGSGPGDGTGENPGTQPGDGSDVPAPPVDAINEGGTPAVVSPAGTSVRPLVAGLASTGADAAAPAALAGVLLLAGIGLALRRRRAMR